MRKFNMFLVICTVTLILSSCHSGSPPICINSSDLAIKSENTYIFRLDEPIVYNCQTKKTSKLVCDPFIQLDRSEMQNQYIVNPNGETSVFAMLNISKYTVYEINPATLESTEDCKIADTSGASSFLGLDSLLGLHMTTGNVSTRSRIYSLFTCGDKQIIVRDNGIYSLKRGKSGYEKCVCEAKIKNTNTAFDGENIYFIDTDNALRCFSLKRETSWIIRDDIYSFYLQKNEVLFSPCQTEKGIYRMDKTGDHVKRIADIQCDAFLYQGNRIVVINAKDKCVYAVNENTGSFQKIIDKAVSKISTFSRDGAAEGICFLSNEGLEYLTVDGIIEKVEIS